MNEEDNTMGPDRLNEIIRSNEIGAEKAPIQPASPTMLQMLGRSRVGRPLFTALTVVAPFLGSSIARANTEVGSNTPAEPTIELTMDGLPALDAQTPPAEAVAGVVDVAEPIIEPAPEQEAPAAEPLPKIMVINTDTEPYVGDLGVLKIGSGYVVDLDKAKELEAYLKGLGINGFDIGDVAKIDKRTGRMTICPTSDDPRCGVTFAEYKLTSDKETGKITVETTKAQNTPPLAEADKVYLNNSLLVGPVANFVSSVKWGNFIPLLSNQDDIKAANEMAQHISEIGGVEFNFSDTTTAAASNTPSEQ